MAEFYYRSCLTVIGPLTGIELREAAFTEQVVPDTLVATDANGPWVPATRVKNLFDIHGRPLPHPPDAIRQIEKLRAAGESVKPPPIEVREPVAPQPTPESAPQMTPSSPHCGPTSHVNHLLSGHPSTPVFRQWISGQTASQLMEGPLLRGVFPYISWGPIGDGRTSDEHEALAKLGLNETSIFRRDDPIFAPWFDARRRGLRPCRCSVNYMTIRQAARRGVVEATIWLESEPLIPTPQWVHPPPFDPWKDNPCELLGWDRNVEWNDDDYRDHPGNPDRWDFWAARQAVHQIKNSSKANNAEPFVIFADHLCLETFSGADIWHTDVLKSAIPELTMALDSQEDDVRYNAAISLAILCKGRSEAAPAMPIIVRAICNNGGMVASGAIEVLKVYGMDAVPALRTETPSSCARALLR